MTMVMVMAPKMGMPKMDIVGMLGSMFSPARGRTMQELDSRQTK